jgi:hypothetical protein
MPDRAFGVIFFAINEEKMKKNFLNENNFQKNTW